MSENDFYTPTDIDALRMENELLAFEVRFLKTRLAEHDRTVAEQKSQPSRAWQPAEDLRKRPDKTERASISPQRKAQLERAEKDLTLLLERLSGSPLGPLLRRRKSFRDLEQRYLKS